MKPISTKAILRRWPGVSEDIDVVKEQFPERKCRFSYAREPLSLFAKVADDMRATYPLFPQDKKRADKIISMVSDGGKTWPIFVEADTLFIMEGRHRVVAFRAVQKDSLDVIYVAP